MKPQKNLVCPQANLVSVTLAAPDFVPNRALTSGFNPSEKPTL